LERIATLTGTAYRKLLSKVRPRVIRTEAENERPLAELEALDNLEELDRPLTREEVVLAEMLTVLIQQFEAARYALGHAAPIDALRNLMEVRGLRQRDLIPVFGANSVVSNVLTGQALHQ
jgi:HTH-type transcriptional regulator/antitoxin HigA